MIFADDLAAVLFGTATLLILGLYTLVNCKRVLKTRAPNYHAFLFDGGSRVFCLAGTLGYAFSITYFGAVIIYGYLFRFGFIVLLGVVGTVSLFAVRLVILRASIAISERPSNGNLLLDLLFRKLGESNATHLVDIYLVAYFALLVEELAVSRVALTLLFPGRQLVAAALLATICAVILAYTKWGGFRAVLAADYEQLKLLMPFIVTVAFLIYRNTSVSIMSQQSIPSAPSGGTLTFLGAALLGFGWIVASVDFYSRLNFTIDSSMNVARERRAFAALAILLTAALFSFAIIYGMSLPSAFGIVQTPEAFMRAGFTYVLSNGSTATRVIVFASIFCMIFSTINALLFTLFQLGPYRTSQWPHIRDIHKLLLWASLLSTALYPNSLSAAGLAIAALLLLPSVGIVASLSDSVRRFLPRNFRFLKVAAVVSLAVILWYFRRYQTDYHRMPQAALVVVASILLCGLVAKIGDFFDRGRRHAQS